ncbi:MAG: thioesterase family protein [Myxococcota bacterium]
MTYRHRRVVRFGECDPAGAVYFPVFFDWFHQAMEAWFEDALGLSYADVVQRTGLPAAHTKADFKSVIRFGDVVFVELRVARLGGRSLTLRFSVVDDAGQLRATGETVCVAIPREPDGGFAFSAAAIPDDLRARIEAFGVEPSD